MPKVQEIDFMITSSRNEAKVFSEYQANQPLKPVANFSRPNIRHRLSYPPSNSFPEGDYGMWREIQIYSFSHHSTGITSN